MRRLALALLLCGCNANVDKLEAINSALERQLAEKMAIANNLNEFRREMDRLDAQLAKAMSGLDGGMPELPKRSPAEMDAPATWVLPEESPLEGSRAKALRQRIHDTQSRIAQLDKVIGEVRNIGARRRDVQDRLDALKALRHERPAPGP
jgi:hypothetical protein